MKYQKELKTEKNFIGDTNLWEIRMQNWKIK